MMGRTTYEMLWPGWSKDTSEAEQILNRMHKYVISTTLAEAPWKESTIIRESAKISFRLDKDYYLSKTITPYKR